MLAGLVITRDVTRPNRRFPLWTSGENRDKDQSEKVDFRWEGTRSSRTRALPARDLRRLRRFLACLGLFVRPQPPGRHVTAVAAVELLGYVVVTSWAATPIVLFGFHCLALTFKFVCLRYPQSSLRSGQPRQPHDGSYRPRYPSARRYL